MGAYKNLGAVSGLRANRTALGVADDRLVAQEATSAVINSLSCPDAQRGYRHALDEFVDWYCFGAPAVL